ncbi:MAG: hypothetical protein ACRD09_05000 [Vicinamibacterales bacterium]
MIAIAAVTATLAWAQARPDFSGTWTLDLSKSEMGVGPGGGGPGGGRPGGGGPGGGSGRAQGFPADARFVVKQTASELLIDQQVGGNSNVSTFKLDGSESVNSGMRGGQVKSKARWDGDKLVIESTQTMTGGGGEMTIDSKEIRSLAADGTMVVERTTTTPRGVRTQKLIFKRTT